MTPKRAFLRGFPATYFPDFGLCGRSRISVAIFGALSLHPKTLHPKIPFLAAGLWDSDSQWRQVAKDAIGSIQKYNSMTDRIAFIPFDLVFRNNNPCSDIAVPSS
jgi:hypothetical protein